MNKKTIDLNDSLIQRDLATLWHPCTQMHDHPHALPLIPIRRGKGIWLEDFNGKRYLDAISSWWVNLFGHNHAEISTAIKDQIDQLEHVLLAGFSHEPALQLAEALVAITPTGLSRVFYTDNGASSVEAALKMSYHWWHNRDMPQKHRFVALTGSYHGETLGALSVTDQSIYRETYAPLLHEPLLVPSPTHGSAHAIHMENYDAQDALNTALQATEQLFASSANEIAAIIIEPLIQCAAGMRMHHAAYLTQLRALCDKYHIHLIADEIAVGFGRTGTLFACEQGHITPDFLCLSKGLTGGYLPLAAVVTTNEIYQGFYAEHAKKKAFLHSHSYTGNPLACRAALATINIFQTQPILEKNKYLSHYMQQQLHVFANHPHVSQLRQCGMVAAFDLQQKNGHPYPWQERRGLVCYRYALEQGVLLRPIGDVVYFMPPYIIRPEEIQHMVKVAYDAVNEATRTQTILTANQSAGHDPAGLEL